MWVHLNTMILATTLVWWLECAVIRGVVESDQLVKSVAEALQHATTTVGCTIRPAGLVTVSSCLPNHLLGDLDDAVENVTQRAAEFPSGCVSRAWRRLDVSHRTGGGDDKGCCDRKCFFHREGILTAYR